MPSLTNKFREKLQCYFPSNPCRLRFGTQEIVIFRDDLLRKFRSNCVILPDLKESKELSFHLTKTIMDENHLYPLPNLRYPIIWNYDNALRLYPTPNLIILADSHEGYQWNYDNCQIVCPGEFSSQGSFIVYTPYDKHVDFSQIS